MSKVIVGISGGVDSSVAAYLLQKQGHEVEGMFMINWHETEGTLAGDCPWNDDLIFAKLVAKKLDIKLHVIDFSDQYRKRVVDYMFREYEKGRTPNPDVLCNREVKFDLFLNKARKMGAEYIATGHYCMKSMTEVDGNPMYRLLAGADPSKEQSYFLCQLSQDQLKHVLFPIGHLYKKEIRQIADKEKLATAKKKDSQGICFVGKVDLPVFLQQKLKAKEGDIIEIDKDAPLYYRYPTPNYNAHYSLNELQAFASYFEYPENSGTIVGKHRGAHFYTIGQRKGLNVGGKKEPLFVIGIDIDKNVVYTGQGHDHPGLNRWGLFIQKDEVHWLRPDLELKAGEKQLADVRIRYRQPLQAACLYMSEVGMFILFKEKQRGIAPGQFAAWYIDGELIGSGVIE